MNEDHSMLLELLAAHAYQYRPHNPFRLASGVTSPEYLDCRQALSRPQALALASRLILGAIQRDVSAVGGLTMGADPLSIGTALASLGQAGTPSSRKPLRWFSVRKQPKGHGQTRRVEGDVKPGDRVLVVDDVATSGGSTIEAVGRCREFGLVVDQVIVLVDREQGGLPAITSQLGPEVPVSAIVTRSAIKRVWTQRNPSTP